jgi:hypothetical protein
MASPRSEKEAAALAQFQTFTKHGDRLGVGELMRYLRARDLDLQKAEDAITAALEWRLRHVEKPLSMDSVSRFESMFQVAVTGFDKEGRIVLHIKFDDWLPIRPLFEEFGATPLILFAFTVLTRLHLRLKETKHQQLVAIWDNAGVGFSKVFHEVQNWAEIQALREVILMADLNFPETLYKAFLINTARAGVWGFSLVRPFLRQYTLNKIQIHGTNPAQWRQRLDEFLEADVIPSSLGGKATLQQSLFEYIR